MALLAALGLMLASIPTPTPRQLAWQKMEAYAFVHFGPNTFTGKEWGEGLEDPKVFAPTEFNADQWVKAFKSAGFTGVILTAKHHDGFCLWPSKFSTHTVAQSNFKRDVVGEVSKAAKRAGLKFGVYLSPWDRNHPTYGTPEYNQIFVKMLEEVLTKYGPIFEVWFDGANGEGPNGKKQEYDWNLFVSTVRKHQPNAVIFSDAGPDVRWVGNESGFAGETNWSTIKRDRYKPGTPHYEELTEGDPEGTDWVPAECDVSIRPGWFWRESENSKVKSGAQIMDLYLKSVGRNGTLLLNVPPDRRGLIHENDAAALAEFGRLRKAYFGKTVRLPAVIDTVRLAEDIQFGQRVSSFELVDEKGQVFFTGTTIGWSRICTFPARRVEKVTVRILASKAEPKLLPMKAYRRN